MKPAVWLAWGLRALVVWGGLEAALWGTDAVGARVQTWQEIRLSGDRGARMWARYQEMAAQRQVMAPLPPRPTEGEIGNVFSAAAAEMTGFSATIAAMKPGVSKIKFVITWSEARSSQLAALSGLAAKWPDMRLASVQMRVQGERVVGEAEFELLTNAPKASGEDAPTTGDRPQISGAPGRIGGAP